MIVSRDRCLQAVCNECEFVGHDREQNVDLVRNESELKNAMFASRGDYVCKLLQVAFVFAGLSSGVIKKGIINWLRIDL